MSEGPSIDPSAEAQMDQANQRLLWTGAAANGALILALIGFAGNADDPVAALRTVTIPALCGITGFTFGGTAISYALAHLAQRPLESIARAKIATAHRQNDAFKDVLSTPAMDPAFARLVWGDQADHQTRALILGRLAAAKDQTEKSPALFEEAMQALRASYAAGIAHMRAAQRWLVASFVAAALGVVLLIGQAWIDPALDRAKAAQPAAMDPTALPKATSPAGPLETAAVPAALPACPGGAPAYQRRERASKEPPQAGTGGAPRRTGEQIGLAVRNAGFVDPPPHPPRSAGYQ